MRPVNAQADLNLHWAQKNNKKNKKTESPFSDITAHNYALRSQSYMFNANKEYLLHCVMSICDHVIRNHIILQDRPHVTQSPKAPDKDRMTRNDITKQHFI